jgi:thioredoxin-like negative regulator of GroEL
MNRREEKLDQLVINDVDAYNQLIEKSAEKLIIIDIHQEWCGVCEAIQPTLVRVTKGNYYYYLIKILLLFLYFLFFHSI